MELQHIKPEPPIPFPPSLDEEAALRLSEQQETLTVILEREDFVKRIEAYCDCV